MRTARVVFFIAFLSASIAGLLSLPVRDWFVQLENHVRSLGALGPVVVALAYILCTVLFIPGSAITVGSGALFGLKTGLAVVVAGANLGALCSFLLARTLLREKVARWADGNPKFRSLDRAIGKQGFKMVLLARLSPVFPFVLLNYFLGLTAVRTGAYALANLIGMLPATFLFVYIGAAARDAIAGEIDPAAGFYQQVLKYIGLLATAAVVATVTRKARQALREAEPAPGDASPGGTRLNPNHKPAAVEDMMLVDDPHDRRLIQNCRPPRWVNPVPPGKYNLVVVGGGTAGLVSAAGAAGLGARVALIERNLLGGDCLNVGCVPSKGLVRAARAAYDARNGKLFGVELSCEPGIAFAAAMERMRRLRADISAHDSAERLRAAGVDVYIGHGRFVGPSAVEIDGRRLEFDRAVIATGARAAELPIPGLAQAGYYTNETVFTLTELPRRIAVIGAGPIGCELAQSFARFGSQVYLIEALHGVLPNEDPDAAEVVRRSMVDRDGVRLVCCSKELRVSQAERGGKCLTVDSHGKRHDLWADAIVVGGGRTPNLEGLGLEEAGVKYTQHGVEVDDRLRTANPRIYAAGDVCSRYKFTHAADAMARIVIANALFSARRKVSRLIIPWCTYTDPEVAHVGYYERDAREAGFDVATITQPLNLVDRAVLDGEDEGFARVHYDRKTGKILGGTIVARRAGEMISELTLAMVARQKVGTLSSTLHPYPTQAEALRKIGDAYMRTRLTPVMKKVLTTWLQWRL
ncbi:MAG TPA: FAD-containing oxidoreductase [candidate division Zixibacteria bacterium]|nr:FAD-containing oxidoreductase [candidate division Zixibacteria bacterium]